MAIDLMRGSTAGDAVNVSKHHLQKRRTQRQDVSAVNKAIPAIVWDYDPETQRVDLLDKNDPNGVPFANMAIANTGGALRILSTPVAANPASRYFGASPTVGLLIFPDSDSSQAFNDHRQQPTPTNLRHSTRMGVFIPGIHVRDDGLPAPNFNPEGGADDIADGDSALVHESGSSIIFKKNGDVIIKAAGNIYGGGADQSVASMKAAARQGDEGDGMGGTIAGGSGRVFLGD